MNISVIIPTYNGAHKVLKILKSIELQTCLPYEVIVVIDGSTDNTVELINMESFKINNLKIIFQENGGRAKVRNTGAKAANGDLLLFFDDDMLPESDCIAQHKQHHLNHPGTILTGAQIDVNRKDISDIRKYKSFLTRKWAEPILGFAEKPIPQKDTFITAANCSMDIETFRSLNGFDERLTDAEDYDLAIRAVESDIALFYNHRAFAWHDDNITCRSYIKRQRQYTCAQSRLHLLHVGRANKYSTSKPQGLKGFFFKLFCFSFWIDSVDSNMWKYILPQKIRYRLYDFILTANASFYPHKVAL
jgi:glycosyltransferase involved in cell wall biosynthesis